MKHSRQKKYPTQKAFSNLYKLVFVLFVCIIFFGVFYIKIIKDLPSPAKLNSVNIPLSTYIYDRNNTLLYTIYSERNQTLIPFSEMPKHLKNATIAIEDKNFYRHGAIDIRGIIRAFYSTLFKQELQGGSTLTQQLVKNTLLTQERTIKRKIKEIILAFITEALYPKDKILEMYLNQSPYGGTAWGIEAAAHIYFGKKAKQLTLAQSALLAGLPASPTTYSPNGAHPEYAKQRQVEVLQRMHEQKYISKEMMEQAIAEPLSIKKISNEIKAPHFVLYVKELLAKKLGEKKFQEGGLSVKTSLDLPIQEFAQASVAAEIEKLKKTNVTNGAVVVTSPKTGEILAMIGSRDYFDSEIDGNVNVTLSLRQPGSSIKPINYAVSLIKGLNAATPFIDQKICYPSVGGPVYCPKNYDGKFHGVVQMRFALANSYNIPAVKALKYNGLDAMIATASAMGISTFNDPNRYGLSLTLGGGEVTMLDMATAYGVFANNGYRIDVHPILKITDRSGKIIEEYKAPKTPIFGKKVLPPGVAYIISHILLDNNARSTVFGANSKLKIGNYPVSAKTGTTNDLRDNWTVGYTPSFVVVAWVGNNDNSEMSSLTSGVTGAAPIWNSIMTHLLKDTKPEWPQQPSSVIGKTVCSTSGLLPKDDKNPNCPTRFEYFIKGMEPKAQETERVKVWIDKATQNLPKPEQTDNLEEKEEIVVTDPTDDRYCLTCPHPQEEEKKEN